MDVVDKLDVGLEVLRLVSASPSELEVFKGRPVKDILGSEERRGRHSFRALQASCTINDVMKELVWPRRCSSQGPPTYCCWVLWTVKRQRPGPRWNHHTGVQSAADFGGQKFYASGFLLVLQAEEPASQHLASSSGGDLRGPVARTQ